MYGLNTLNKLNNDAIAKARASDPKTQQQIAAKARATGLRQPATAKAN